MIEEIISQIKEILCKADNTKIDWKILYDPRKEEHMIVIKDIRKETNDT